ncbi:hypothetical protein M434DRAFT_10690 [Hypoxylon sp. CO27-5]|nr:hypothetical protein M434DRAFT_10690 [Hypoxylon sp. CO27-5]
MGHIAMYGIVVAEYKGKKGCRLKGDRDRWSKLTTNEKTAWQWVAFDSCLLPGCVLGYRGVGLLANVEKETGAKRDANSLPMRFEKGKKGKGAAIEFSVRDRKSWRLPG